MEGTQPKDRTGEALESLPTQPFCYSLSCRRPVGCSSPAAACCIGAVTSNVPHGLLACQEGAMSVLGDAIRPRHAVA